MPVIRHVATKESLKMTWLSFLPLSFLYQVPPLSSFILLYPSFILFIHLVKARLEKHYSCLEPVQTVHVRDFGNPTNLREDRT